MCFEDYGIKIDVSITGRHLAAFVSNTGIFGVVDLRNGGRLLYGRSFNSDVTGYLGRPEEDERYDTHLVQRHYHYAFITTCVNRIFVLIFSDD